MLHNTILNFVKKLSFITYIHIHLQMRKKNSFLEDIWNLEMLGQDVIKELLNK